MPLIPLFRNVPPLKVRELTYGVVSGPPPDPDAVPVVPKRRNAQGRVVRGLPYGDAKVAEVRHYFENTTLNYHQITRRTGVGHGTLCRWFRDQGWVRPIDAPRCTDRMPTWRASQLKKLRQLDERLRLLAERHIRQLEEAPEVDPARLIAAVELVKMTRLHAQGRRRHAVRLRRGLPPIDKRETDERARISKALSDLRACGVDPDKVPKEAMELVIDANLAPLDEALRMRRRRGSGRWD